MANLNLNTVEELAGFVIKRRPDKYDRWQLQKRENFEWQGEDEDQKRVLVSVDYYLQKKVSDWNSKYVYLSQELGETLEKVWGTRDRFPSSPGLAEDFTHMTLQGVLKKLGKSDIAEQVKEAREAAEVKEARQRKYNNAQYYLEGVENLSKKLKGAEVFGDTQNMSLSQLTDLFRGIMEDNKEPFDD